MSWVRKHMCDQMVCTHVPRVETSSAFSPDECDELIPPARGGGPAESGSLAQVTVRLVYLGLDLILELDPASCTPRDVICHLIGEGTLPRPRVTQARSRYHVALRQTVLALDVPLAAAGVTDGDVLEIHPAMVV